MIRFRPRPESEIEDDSGAAGEREEREDDADERDVDAEGLRDSGADPGESTLVSACREGRERHRRSSYGARHAYPADADVCVENEHASTGLVDALADVPSVGRLPEHLDLSELRVRVQPQRDVVGDDDTKVADIDPC